MSTNRAFPDRIAHFPFCRWPESDVSLHRVLRILAPGLALACAPPAAPPAVTPLRPVAAIEPDATPVSAGVDATWQAVLRVLAARRIPVRNADRPNGRLVAGPVPVDSAGGLTWGECDRPIAGWESRPTRGEAVALVRAEAGGSTIRITMRWTAAGWDVTRECVARGSWEQALERDVKQLAERAGKAP